jgi:hypothetical protein
LFYTPALDVASQNAEASAISRQMSDVGFNDFHVSAALQYRCENHPVRTAHFICTAVYLKRGC